MNLLTARPKSTRTIQPYVAERLLGEIPRFFNGSVETMLRELLQNAFRANAQNVVVTVDSARHTLTVQDDGCGISDPNLVLAAGATGWDENKVIEPAGLGLFSLLAENTLKVVIASWREQCHPWRMTLTQEQLRGMPACVEEIPTAQTDGPSGTLVEITLREIPSEIESTVCYSRALYPFNVTLNLDGQSRTVLPYRAWMPEVTFAIPGVGTLEWTSHQRTADSEVVWLHQVLPNAYAFHTALNQVAQENPAFAIFRDYAFRWIVDPQCGVRPKLPDRTDLMDDVHLRQAIRQIAETFSAHMMGIAETTTRGIEVLSLSWRVRYAVENKREDWKYYCDDAVDMATAEHLTHLPAWLRKEEVLERVLSYLGWVKSILNVYADYEIYEHDQDGVIYDEEKRKRMYRTLPAVSSAAVAFTLTQQGKPTRWEPRAKHGRVTISGLQTNSQSPHIALCQTIQVEGIGEMPYLITEGGFTTEADGFEIKVEEKRGRGEHTRIATHHPCLLFAGTAAQFSRWLEDNQDWVLNFIVVSRMECCSIWDYDWMEGDDLQTDRVLRDVLTEVSVFDRQLARARRAYYDTGDTLRDLAEIKNRIAVIRQRAHGSSLSRRVQMMERQADALSRAVEKIHTRLQAEAGLAEVELP